MQLFRCLQSRLEVGVCGEDDAHIVVFAEAKPDEIDGQGYIDAFLSSRRSQPITRVLERPGDDSDGSSTALPVHLILQMTGRKGAGLTLGIRYASVHANLDEPTPVGAASNDQPAEPQRIELSRSD